MKAKINGTTVEILKDDNGELILRVHGMEHSARVLYYNHETNDLESKTFVSDSRYDMLVAVDEFRKSLDKADKVCKIDKVRTPYYKRLELTHYLAELISHSID